MKSNIYSLEFGIDRLPKTLNKIGRQHWFVKVRENNELRLLVSEAVKNQKPRKPLHKAELTLTRYSSHPSDPDNLVISFKPIIDALVKEGVLEDDRMTNIGMPRFRWKPAKRGHGKITVKVVGVE